MYSGLKGLDTEQNSSLWWKDQISWFCSPHEENGWWRRGREGQLNHLLASLTVFHSLKIYQVETRRRLHNTKVKCRQMFTDFTIHMDFLFNWWKDIVNDFLRNSHHDVSQNYKRTMVDSSVSVCSLSRHDSFHKITASRVWCASKYRTP